MSKSELIEIDAFFNDIRFRVFYEDEDKPTIEAVYLYDAHYRYDNDLKPLLRDDVLYGLMQDVLIHKNERDNERSSYIEW